MVGIVAIVVLLVGLIIMWARSKEPKSSPPNSIARSWLAVSLVAGLLLFLGFAFAINDATLRSTLTGALAASAAAAVTFYFSSKSSDQARADLLNAVGKSEEVPQLVGKTEAQAASELAKTGLKLAIDPDHRPATPDAEIASQFPIAGATAASGSAVTIAFG